MSLQQTQQQINQLADCLITEQIAQLLLSQQQTQQQINQLLLSQQQTQQKTQQQINQLVDCISRLLPAQLSQESTRSHPKPNPAPKTRYTLFFKLEL